MSFENKKIDSFSRDFYVQIVQSLGGKVVEHVEECTHLVTDKVKKKLSKM